MKNKTENTSDESPWLKYLSEVENTMCYLEKSKIQIPPPKMVTLKSQMFFQKENSSYDERVVEDECAVAWDEESHVLFYMQNNTSLT